MAELEPAYLLTGTDRPKVERALRRLRDRIGDDATELLSAHETSGADAVGACNALGLFATERRLVVVEHADAWKKPDIDAVVAYLAAPAETTVLALVADQVKPDAPLALAVADAGSVLAYELPKRGSKADLPGWVAKQLAALGATAVPAVPRLVVELVGDDLTELSAEVEKLAVWAAGDTITERDVELLVAPRAELPPFALTDAWGRRDLGGVLEAAERLLDRAGGSATAELSRVVALLTSHVERVAECQALAAEGVTTKQAAEKMKKNRYYVEKLYQQAGSFTADELRGAIVRLARLDRDLKGGSRLGGELEFARGLLDATRPAERAAAAG